MSAVFGREFASLAARAAGLGVRLSRAQVAVCERYAAELIERNKTVNLTAITEVADVAAKHFLDSFTAIAVRAWTGRERVIDVGSGAGFPGLALRIAMPDVRLTSVESVGRNACSNPVTVRAASSGWLPRKNAIPEINSSTNGTRASKKRYVGWKFEAREQKEGVLDAKVHFFAFDSLFGVFDV